MFRINDMDTKRIEDMDIKKVLKEVGKYIGTALSIPLLVLIIIVSVFKMIHESIWKDNKWKTDS